MSATAVRTEHAPRGRVWLYAIAFVMLLVAGWLQVKGNLNSNLRQVQWSMGLSVAAVVVAVASVVVPGRRRRLATDVKPAASRVTGNGSDGTTPNPADPDAEPHASASEPKTQDATPDTGPKPEPPEPPEAEGRPKAEAPEPKTVAAEPGEAKPREIGERPSSAP